MDKVVDKYIETRDRLDEIKAAYEEMCAPLKVLQEKREEWMLGQLSQAGAQNMKTLHGTAYVAVKESVTVGEWNTVLNWVREGERWEFLNQAVNKTAVLEAMGEKKENPPPPGVNYVAIRTVNVRRS